MPWDVAEQPAGTQYVLTGVDTNPAVATAGVNGTRAFFRVKQAGALPRVDVPTVLSADTDILLDLVWDKAPAGATWEFAWDIRRVNATNTLQVRLRIPPTPTGMTLELWRLTNNVWDLRATYATGLPAAANTPVRIRAQARGTSPIEFFQARIWLASGTEPATYQAVSTSIGSASLQFPGAMGWGVSVATGTPTNLPVLFSYDNLDWTDPVQPIGANLQGTSAGTAAAIGTLTTAIRFAGASSGTASAVGVLIIPPNMALTGTSAGHATAAGQLSIPGQGMLTGSSAGTSTASGVLTTGTQPPSLPPGGAIMSVADFAENKMLDVFFGRHAYTVPVNYYVQLTSVIPTDATPGTALLARKQVPNDTVNWPVATGGQKSNGLAINFGTTVGQVSLPSAVGWEIWDAVTGGNRLWWGTLRSSFNVSDRRTVSLPPGALTIGLD